VQKEKAEKKVVLQKGEHKPDKLRSMPSYVYFSILLTGCNDNESSRLPCSFATGQHKSLLIKLGV